MAAVEGLDQIEIAALATVAANADGPEGAVWTWSVRQDMEKSGYTPIATTLGLGSLMRKEMLTSETDEDQNGAVITAYRVSPKGFDWLLQNKERLVLRSTKNPTPGPPELTEDDIPF